MLKVSPLLEIEVDTGTDCKACTLYKTCKSPNIKPVGNKNSEVLIIGEAPGRTEDQLGIPFVGKSGAVLNEALEKAGINRDDVLITNTVRCKPYPHKNPKLKEVNACKKRHLLPLIDRQKPKLIVTVGAIALEALTGLDGITKRQNKPFYSQEYGCMILPLLHPARFLRPTETSERDRIHFFTGVSKINTLLLGDTKTYDYGDYTVLYSVKSILKTIAYLKAHPILCFDLEATGFDGKKEKITAIGLACKERECFLIPLKEDEFTPEEKDIIINNVKELLEDKSIEKLGQNLKFDIQFILHRWGIKVKGWSYDTLLEHFLLDETKRTHNLSDMTWKYLPGLAGYDDSVKATGGAHLVEDPNTLYTYCMADVDSTFRLHNIFSEKLKEEGQWWFYKNVLVPAANVLCNMEIRGIKLDRNHLETLEGQLTKKKFKVEAQMEVDPGVKFVEDSFGKKFNPRSYPMLKKLLLEYHKLPVLGYTEKLDKKTGEKNPKLDKGIIERYAKEYNNNYSTLLTTYRQADKMCNSYVRGFKDAMDEDDIVHPHYFLDLTDTGRTSVQNPPVQTIPRIKDYKNMVISRDGFVLIYEDFSQSEIRVGAMISGDKNLIAVCNDITKDFHTAVASKAFSVPYEKVNKELRQNAKGVTFGIFYQMGPEALAAEIGKSVPEAKKIIAEYFSAYPDLRVWIDNTIQLVKKQHWVQSPFGRRRRFPNYDTLEFWQQAECERQGVNAIVQATSSDFMLIAMTRMENRFIKSSMKSRVILEVHDSVTVEASIDEIEKVYDIMKEEIAACTRGFEWAERVTMKGDIKIGTRWGELLPYDKWLEDCPF